MIDEPRIARPERTLIQKLRLAIEYASGRVGMTLSTWHARISLASWGASVGPGLIVRGRLRVHNGGALRIAENVRINSGPANYVGGDRRMALWVSSTGTLEIGNRCALSNSTIVCRDRVTIKEDVFIGGGCEIYDSDFHQLASEDRIANRGPIGHEPVEIGPRAFIGGGTMILKGVTIGRGAVIGAGSVVTRSIPPEEVWAGVPAKFIRKLDESSTNIGDDDSKR